MTALSSDVCLMSRRLGGWIFVQRVSNGFFNAGQMEWLFQMGIASGTEKGLCFLAHNVTRNKNHASRQRRVFLFNPFIKLLAIQTGHSEIRNYQIKPLLLD